MLAIGGEVTRDTTTEIYSPPYLDKGPRPSITSAPEAMLPGQELTVSYTSEDPVARAILIRNAAATHSMAFGGLGGKQMSPGVRSNMAHAWHPGPCLQLGIVDAGCVLSGRLRRV